MMTMTEREALRRLTGLIKDKPTWPDHMPEAAALLTHPACKVRAKAMWLLGEMGLLYPASAAPYVETIAGYLTSAEPLLRERALNALGRIGRGDRTLIEPYLPHMRLLADDGESNVRLAFIWACENIATNAPEMFADDMPLFAALLDDKNGRVRMEAPEIFRVLGKRRPEYVIPYISKLQKLADNDPQRVVRIHAVGTIRATEKAGAKNEDKG